MPQSKLQVLQGYVKLTADTLTQRYVNRKTPVNHPVLSGTEKCLAGRTAIVTGANTGLGLETVKMLAAAGATVVMGCRNMKKASEAAKKIWSSVPEASLQIEPIDLSSVESVREFAAKFSHDAPNRPLHMLILNGGVMGVDHANPETHFMVNYVGHFLLTMLLLPNLSAAKEECARVVLVSSLTYLVSDLRLDDLSFRTRNYDWMTAYANSKLCMILFMKGFQTRLAGCGISVNAVHPGEATSDVARNLGRVWMALHKNVGALFLLSPTESARTSVYVAAADELRSETGKVFHRVTETLDVPEWLVGEKDVADIWDISIRFSGLDEMELERLIEAARP